jgi:hypothetical protein
LAKFDQGGGCPCGLYRECEPNCEHKVTKMQEHDFGFTFANEEDYTKVEKVVDQEKLKQLRDMIMPLLLNLKKNPDKDIIQWPGKDRIKSVDAFIKKMDKLLD